MIHTPTSIKPCRYNNSKWNCI